MNKTILKMLKISSFVVLLFTLTALTIVSYVSAQEVFVQVNLRHPINIVSDKYVSFSIDPNILLDNMNRSNSNISDFMAQQLRPAYLRVSGESFEKLTLAISQKDYQVNVSQSKAEIPQEIWKNFNRWIRLIGWKPVIPISYTPNEWNPRESLQILNISSSLGVKDCIWQLGSDFNATDADQYVNDLKTLKTMVDAFKVNTTNWGVVGADISAGSSPDETRKFLDAAVNTVKAVGWRQQSSSNSFDPLEDLIYERELALMTILNRPIPTWLTLSDESYKSEHEEHCSSECVRRGLEWAQTLGDAAQTGFNVIYKNLDRFDIYHPGFRYYITLLFKKTMGELVFDTRVMAGDRFASHVFSHCSKQRSGGLAIMGINTASYPMTITTNFGGRNIGTEKWQYILSVKNGKIFINDIEADLEGATKRELKIKMLRNRPFSAKLPPNSIGFWTIPSMKIEECERGSLSLERFLSVDEQDRKIERTKTSSDQLLQQLISENFLVKSKDLENAEESQSFRAKRFVLKGSRSLSDLPVFRSFFETIPRPLGPLTTNEMPRWKKSIQGPKYRRVNRFRIKSRRYKRSIKERIDGLKERIAANKISNLRKTLNEQKIFASKENPNLPQGDVHIRLANGPNPDYDYVEVDNQHPDRQNEKILQRFPNNFPESYRLEQIVPRLQPQQKHGELWEVISKPEQPKKHESNQFRTLPGDKIIGYVVQELEPTQNQNNLNMQKTQQQLEGYYFRNNDGNHHHEQPNNYEIDQPVVHWSEEIQEPETGLLRKRKFVNLNLRKRKMSLFGKNRLQKRSLENFHGKSNLVNVKTDKETSVNEKQENNKRNIRSSSIIDTIAWTMDENSSNLIPKELGAESDLNRIVPVVIIKNYHKSFRPEEFQTTGSSRSSSSKTAESFMKEEAYIPTEASLTNNYYTENENPQSKELSALEEKRPKFLVAFSDGVNNFMDMLSRHVTGWWNAFT